MTLLVWFGPARAGLDWVGTGPGSSAWVGLVGLAWLGWPDRVWRGPDQMGGSDRLEEGGEGPIPAELTQRESSISLFVD